MMLENLGTFLLVLTACTVSFMAGAGWARINMKMEEIHKRIGKRRGLKTKIIVPMTMKFKGKPPILRAEDYRLKDCFIDDKNVMITTNQN